MRKILAASAMLLVLVACTMTPMRKTYNTIYSVEAVTSAAVDGYFDSVAKGKVKTNGVPVVAKAYDGFQAVVHEAVTLMLGNTNAPATPALRLESQKVLNAIDQARQ